MQIHVSPNKGPTKINEAEANVVNIRQGSSEEKLGDSCFRKSHLVKTI